MFVHEQDFKGAVLESFLPYRPYAEWLLYEADLTETYRYQKRLMQVLQWEVRGRWILKMPSHALHLKDLFAVFPDANCIVCHRDPLKALGSLCSLLESPHTMAYGKANNDILSSFYPEQMAEHCYRPMQWRKEHGNGVFHDLHYNQFLSEPLSEIQAICQFAGQAWNSEIETTMQNYLNANPQGKHGSHSYTLGQYGIDAEKVRPRFQEYVEQCKVSTEL